MEPRFDSLPAGPGSPTRSAARGGASNALEILEAVWRFSDGLFSLLDEKAIHLQPIALRQPFLFYVGHLPAFAWAKIGVEFLSREPFAPGFDRLFARGIDPTDVDSYEAGDAWPP